MAVSAAAVLLQTLCFCFFRLSSADAENITAVVGENVTLTCKVPNNNNSVMLVEWTRPDLNPDQVLLYRSNKFHPDLQHPSFQNRVDLQDLQKGDVSLILKNLTMNDSGTYECHVGQKETNRHKRDADLINTINLSVVPSGDKHEVKEEEEDRRFHSGMYWIVPLVVTAVLAVVVFLIIRRRKKNSSSRPDEPADVKMNPLNSSDRTKQLWSSSEQMTAVDKFSPDSGSWMEWKQSDGPRKTSTGDTVYYEWKSGSTEKDSGSLFSFRTSVVDQDSGSSSLKVGSDQFLWVLRSPAGFPPDDAEL